MRKQTQVKLRIKAWHEFCRKNKTNKKPEFDLSKFIGDAPEKKGGIKMQILLVDDEQYQLETLKRGIRTHGHQVFFARNGEEALRHLEKHADISLIITDYLMPGMNGITLVKMIRELYGDIPVILMTAYGDKELVLEALRSRCDDYIDKPFKPSELIALINEVQWQRKKRELWNYPIKKQIKKSEKPKYVRIERLKRKFHELELDEDSADNSRQALDTLESKDLEDLEIKKDIDLKEKDEKPVKEENPLARLGGGLGLAVPLVKVAFPIFIFVLMTVTTVYLLVLPFFR